MRRWWNWLNSDGVTIDKVGKTGAALAIVVLLMVAFGGASFLVAKALQTDEGVPRSTSTPNGWSGQGAAPSQRPTSGPVPRSRPTVRQAEPSTVPVPVPVPAATTPPTAGPVCSFRTAPEDNVLTNWDFHQPSGKGDVSVGPGDRDTESSAAKWGIMNHAPAATGTRLSGSTCTSGRQMLEVCTDGPGNGVVNVFGAVSNVRAAVWVYIEYGAVTVELARDGSGAGSERTVTDPHRWLLVEVPASDRPLVRLLISSSQSVAHGALFYVDSASVSSASPASTITPGPTGTSFSPALLRGTGAQAEPLNTTTSCVNAP